MLISIVIPVFNEENNLTPLYETIKKLFEKLKYVFELIFIDDGSQDGSLKVMENLSQKDPRVKILSLSRNFGQQVALSAGLDYANGAAVILMDADLQHPPAVIEELLKKWQEGYENVYTIRKESKNTSFFKKFTSAVFYRIFRRLTKLNLPMNSPDFRLLDRKLVLQLRKIRERNRFLRGLIFWAGFRSVGIEYDENARHSGEIKYNFKKMFLFAIDALTSFTNVPLYFGILIGLIVAMLGVIYLGYALYIRFVLGISVAGWASLVCLVSILGGIQLTVVGLVGVYIGKIFEEVKQRPLYLISYLKGFNESGPV